jgi:hypothetical protein
MEENGEWLFKFRKEIWRCAELAFCVCRSVKAHEKPLYLVNVVWE